MKREIQQLAEKYNWEIEKIRTKRHTVLYLKHKTGIKAVVTSSSTPSDPRAFKNLEASIKRITPLLSS